MRRQDNIFQNIANSIIADSPEKSSLRQSGMSLYDDFCTLIFNVYRDLSAVPKRQLVAFCRGNKDVFSIEIQSSAIKITLNTKFGMLEDRKNLFRDVSKVGHWGNGDYQVKLENNEHFDYVIELIKQIS